MINSNSISSTIQTPFHFPSELYKNPSTSSHHTSFNFPNTNLLNPSISIKTIRNKLIPKTATTNDLSLTHETLYDLLGISESGTLLEIKRAYKEMALKYHPDVSPPERANEYTLRFIMVQEAYETLSDPESRAMYDSSIAKGLHLAFSGSRFQARSKEKAQWKNSWEVQLAELKRTRVVHGRRMSWAARIREQRSETGGAYGSALDE